MSYSKDEARLALIEQIAWVLTYINTDDTSTDEEADTVFEEMLNISAEVTEVLENDVTLVQIKLKDGEKFVQDLLGRE
jgi:hypothetical protein